MNRNEICALLILGPSHGAQIFLPNPLDVYLVPGQPELGLLTQVRDAGMTLASMPVHQYRRVHECIMPKNRGYWIYEYDGLTRT